MAEIGEKLLAARTQIKDAIAYAKLYGFSVCSVCNGTGEPHSMQSADDADCFECDGEGFINA